jgi:NADPH:quinone reductase-like Zn-dependent oxidoreductase
MKALRQIGHGDAATALEVVDLPIPTPAVGEIVVQMECAPLHTSDVLNITDAKRTPTVPRNVGTEGVGRVSAVGDGITTFNVGQRVLPPKRCGTFSEYVVCAATDAYAAPEHCDAEALSIVQTMGLTAYLLMNDFAQLPAGSWIIQNAANSSTGRILIGLARHRGLHTINIVRRDQAALELKALGADVVITDTADADALAAKIPPHIEISLGLDMIGGAATARLAHCLSKTATLVLYGANSGAAAQIDFIDLARNNLTVTGFGLSRSFNRFDHAQKAKIMSEIAALAATGVIATPVAARYQLSDYQAAFAHAAQSSSDRNGKVIFRF